MTQVQQENDSVLAEGNSGGPPTVRPIFTVVTATLNCSALLTGLIASLEAQTDPEFEWVVADGDSRDATLAIARAAKLRHVVVDVRTDFGIYDALNRGIRLSSGRYYLVLGADDRLFPDAIASFKRALAEAEATGVMPSPDLIVASVSIDGDRVLRPMSAPTWRSSGNGLISNHAVGTAFRRDLHDRFGYYSSRYVNSADMLFVRTVMAAPGAKLLAADFVAGYFATSGVSSTDRIATMSEVFRVQLKFEKHKWFQFWLYVSRVMREL